jgi:DNA-binding MarR family transcriptional regulator
VGTLQMAVMMLIGSHGGSDYQITVKEIKDTLKIDDDTLYKNIKSLMMKQFKLLEIRGASS